MSIQIKLKNSVVQDSTPSTSDLPAVGELALNANINSIGGFMRASNNTIVKIFGPGSVTTPTASTTVAGISELATNAETTTGSATNRVVTPAGLNAVTVAERTTSNTNYVAKAGSTLTGVLTMPNGSNSAPAINFGDSDTGIFGGTNTVSLSAGGTTRLTAATGVSVTGTLTVNGAITSSGNLTIADKIIHSGDTDTTIRFPTANIISFETAGSERLRFENNARIFYGKTTNRQTRLGTNSFSPNIQIEDQDVGAVALTRFNNNNSPFRLTLNKGRGTIATPAAVVEDDLAGQILFSAFDGSNFCNTAKIDSKVDGTPGTDDMPGNLIFYTTPDGDNGADERLRITSTGNVGIGTNAPSELLHLKSTTVDVDLLVEATGTNKDARVRLNAHSGGLSQIQFGDQNDGNIGLLTYDHTDNSMQFRVNDLERMRINNAGKLLIGSSAARSISGINAPLQIQGTDVATSSIGLYRNSNDNQAPFIVFGKSRGTGNQSNVSVQADDVVAAFRFGVADGTDSQSFCGQIKVEMDGTVGSNDTPGRLVFGTTAAGNSSPTNRLFIDNAGTVRVVNDLSISDKIIHSGDTNTAIRFPANDTVTVETAGLERLRVRSGGQVVIGVDSTLLPAATATLAVVGSYSGAPVTPFLYMTRNEAATSISANESLGQISYSSNDGLRGASINAAASGAWTGSSCPSSLRFLTTPVNATVPVERMRVTSDGRIGIGESSPAYKLVVNSGTTDTVANFVSTDSIARIRIIDGDGTTGVNIQAINDEMILSANGTSEDFRIDTAGNVGIGEPDPQTRLHVRAGSNVALRLDDSGQSYGQITYNNGSNSTDALTIAVDEGNTQASSTMRFRVDASEKMRLIDSGFLGIGATTPRKKLHVHGTDTELIRLSAPGDSGNVNQFGIGFVFAANQNNPAALITAVEFDPSDNRAHLVFATRSSNTDSAPGERMRIAQDGNVYIGTDSGNSRLLVQGSGNGSGANALVLRNSDSTNLMYVRNDGAILTGTLTASPYNTTTTSAANCNIQSNGRIRRSTSSIRYKKDITDATWGLAEVLKLKPVNYKSNGTGENADDKTYGGFTAEDIHDLGLTEFVEYNESNQPDALNYGNMVALLANAIKELAAKVTKLEGA